MSYFIGSMVPAEARKLIHTNRPVIGDVRWVNSQKYHITFEYFAELSNELVDEVHLKVQTLSAFFPLQCEVKCYSGFPTNRKARVIIALLNLANTKIETVYYNKRFTPHVTVGYARSGKVYVPQTSLDLQFVFDRPAVFRSESGIYTEITAKNA